MFHPVNLRYGGCTHYRRRFTRSTPIRAPGELGRTQNGGGAAFGCYAGSAPTDRTEVGQGNRDRFGGAAFHLDERFAAVEGGVRGEHHIRQAQEWVVRSDRFPLEDVERGPAEVDFIRANAAAFNR